MAGAAKLAKLAGSKIVLKSAGKITRRVGANGKIKRGVSQMTNDLVKKNERELDKKASKAIKSANRGMQKTRRARGYRDVLREKLRNQENSIDGKKFGIPESLKKIERTKNKIVAARTHEGLGETQTKYALNRFDKIADEIGYNNKKRAIILSERARRRKKIANQKTSRRKYACGGKMKKKC